MSIPGNGGVKSRRDTCTDIESIAQLRAGEMRDGDGQSEQRDDASTALRRPIQEIFFKQSAFSFSRRRTRSCQTVRPA